MYQFFVERHVVQVLVAALLLGGENAPLALFIVNHFAHVLDEESVSWQRALGKQTPAFVVRLNQSMFRRGNV